MDIAILTAIISLAGLGYATIRPTLRALEKRMDSLDKRMDGLQQQHRDLAKQMEANRIQNEQQHRDLVKQMEANRVQNEQQHLIIIDLLRNHGERIAHIEGRKEVQVVAG